VLSNRAGPADLATGKAASLLVMAVGDRARAVLAARCDLGKVGYETPATCCPPVSSALERVPACIGQL